MKFTQTQLTLGLILLFVFLILFFSSFFIVTEVQQVVVTQFGRPVRVIAGESPFTDKAAIEKSVQVAAQQTNSNVQLNFGAGLYFKVPFVQKVEYFDDRILEYDSEPAPITTRDKKRLVVDNYARWRISDPLRFKQRIQSIALAQARLDDTIYSFLRSQLGEHDFIDIVRSTDNILTDKQSEIPKQKLVSIQTGRGKIMERVTEMSRQAALEYGIHIVDVRIKRADPPKENLDAVFQNMTAERNRIAQKYREEGKRDSTIIHAETDRTVKTMKAEAERKSRVIKGNADAEAARIYAKGFIKEASDTAPIPIAGFETNPEFYQFLRSLDALEAALDSHTAFILGTNNDLLRFLNQPTQIKKP